MSKFRIGVDGGGTTTRAVVVNETLAVLGRGEAASSNLYNVGLESAVANVKAAIDDALHSAQIEIARVDSFGFGLAGVVGEAEKSRWHFALSTALSATSSTRSTPKLVAEPKIVVAEDAAATLAGAFGDDFATSSTSDHGAPFTGETGDDARSKPAVSPPDFSFDDADFATNSDENSGVARHGGAILIAGTGANCYGQNASGETARADGWGPLLGDRGSGFWIGEATLRAALSAADGAAPPTSLQNAVLEHFHVADWNALAGVVYAPDFRRERIAALVPRVLEAARNGDEIAAQILEKAGENLARTALAVLSKLQINRLAPSGGLLENSATVRQALEESLKREIPNLKIVAPQYEAVVGAAILGALAEAEDQHRDHREKKESSTRSATR